MQIYDVLMTKRHGRRLSPEQIAFAIGAYTNGEMPDYQMSALLTSMAIRGLDTEETSALVEAMLHSGEILNLSAVPGIKVDKHGTGGVAQPVSEVVAPVVAAAGVPVPMLSGRGMGHTRGTLDKLQAIGCRIALSTDEFVRQLQAIGVAIMGATPELAPADRKLLSLRAATATVDTIELMAASIMSKKLAEGADRLVVDVKAGTGAFLRRDEDALALARLLVQIGQRHGVETVCYVTDMNQPLGYAIGTALEVLEVLEILSGRARPTSANLVEVCTTCCAEMLVQGGKASDLAAARREVAAVLADGRGLAKYRQMIEWQGGDVAAVDDPDRLPTAAQQVVVTAPRSGYIQEMEAHEMALAAVILGAGRQRVEDQLDFGAGIVLHEKRGAYVTNGQPLATIHVNNVRRLEEARARFTAAYRIGDEPPRGRPVIKWVVRADEEQVVGRPADVPAAVPA